MGGNDPPLVLGMPFGYCVEELQSIHSQLRFWKKNNIHGTPFFLAHTPEMALSFLQDDVIREFVKRPIEYTYKDKSLMAISSDIVKVNIFNKQEKFVIEPRVKYNGFEYIQKARISTHANIKLANANKDKWEGACYHDYHTLLDRLSTHTL